METTRTDRAARRDRPRRVVGLTFKPIFDHTGGIAHVERLTRWYGGRETMDTISTNDYQAVCDGADIAYYCDTLDKARERDRAAYATPPPCACHDQCQPPPAKARRLASGSPAAFARFIVSFNEEDCA